MPTNVLKKYRYSTQTQYKKRVWVKQKNPGLAEYRKTRRGWDALRREWRADMWRLERCGT
jgi:hypothetical protein